MSATSHMMRMLRLSFTLSPFPKQSNMESSSTEFMSSIHIASIGPSKISHLDSDWPSRTYPFIIEAPRPSLHSWVCGSTVPYNSSLVIDLGFIRLYLVGIHCEIRGFGFASFSLSSNLCSIIQFIEFFNVSKIYDLPELVGPTNTTPNLRLQVS